MNDGTVKASNKVKLDAGKLLGLSQISKVAGDSRPQTLGRLLNKVGEPPAENQS